MALGRQLIIERLVTAPSTFASMCVTEQRSLEINNEEIDITKPNCASPGGKLAFAAMYGIQSFRVAGAGAFVNVASQKAAVADAVAQTVTNYRITVPEVGTFTGDGLISVTMGGGKTDEMTADFRITLSGAVTFTPAA